MAEDQDARTARASLGRVVGGATESFVSVQVPEETPTLPLRPAVIPPLAAGHQTPCCSVFPLLPRVGLHHQPPVPNREQLCYFLDFSSR
jgi:hypothetical protein